MENFSFAQRYKETINEIERYKYEKCVMNENKKNIKAILPITNIFLTTTDKTTHQKEGSDYYLT